MRRIENKGLMLFKKTSTLQGFIDRGQELVQNQKKYIIRNNVRKQSQIHEEEGEV